MKRHSTETKLLAALASFLTIIGFIVALLAKRDDKYIMYYAKHGLVLFIAQLIVALVANLAFLSILTVPVTILFLIAWAWCWISALTGEVRNIPVITSFAEKIDL